MLGINDDQTNKRKFLTHFFADFSEGDEKKRAELYFQLRASKGQIVLSDVQQTRASASTSIDVKPYQISQVFLQALLVSPAQWSEQFYKLFDQYLGFVKKNNGVEFKDYLPEFEWLRALYLRSHEIRANGQSISLPELPKTADGHVVLPILPNLEKLQGEAMCGNYSKIVLMLNELQQLGDEKLKMFLDNFLEPYTGVVLEKNYFCM